MTPVDGWTARRSRSGLKPTGRHVRFPDHLILSHLSLNNGKHRDVLSRALMISREVHWQKTLRLKIQMISSVPHGRRQFQGCDADFADSVHQVDAPPPGAANDDSRWRDGRVRVGAGRLREPLAIQP